MKSRHVRAYRALLRVYPGRFRRDYRDEMTRLFADQLRDARSTKGGVGVLGLWVRSLVDLVLTAPGQHLEHEEVLVASPVGAPGSGRLARSGRSRIAVVLVALVPLWLFIFLAVAAPGFMDPVFADPPAIVGLPAGLVLHGLALAWMAIGVVIVLSTWSTIGWVVALALFSAPAAAAIMLGPAVVLIALNLAV